MRIDEYFRKVYDVVNPYVTETQHLDPNLVVLAAAIMYASDNIADVISSHGDDVSVAAKNLCSSLEYR